MNVNGPDLVAALTKQRDAAMNEAAMNYALCLGYEKRIAELEEKLKDKEPVQ